MKQLLTICALLLLAASDAAAEVRLSQLFQSGMVLQRGKPIPIWGWAEPGETVTLTFKEVKSGGVKSEKWTYTTTADADGRWRIDLPKMKAGGPYTLEVSTNTHHPSPITDILIGDVWLCSGQSNIDVTIERVYPQYPQEIDSYENPQIRLFRVQNETDTHGVRDDIRPTPINWLPLSKQNAWPFSAVGYFLGKRMYEKSGVPQGIIVNSWGGTPIEAWISADSLQRDYPLYVEKTRLYQDDELVKAQQTANQRANDRWYQLMNEADPGMASFHTGEPSSYTAPDFDDSVWPEIHQFDWQWPGIGSYWLRQHIYINKEHAGRPARLLLGTLFDADYTYLNGQEIGRTYYQYPPRRYDIPEGLLREGDNVLCIRFVNKYGTAHFIPEKPYLLAFGDDRCSQNPMPEDVIPLSQTWRHHVGVEMPACPSADVSLQNLPTTLYNAVLHPLAPYALSGIVWYQGESNTGNPAPYADLLRRLMGCWRDRWQEPTLPFAIVQLANFMAPSEQPQESNWARLREAQRIVAKEDPYAELAVINDLGEAVDIHPLRKKEVAERIGLCFDRLLYIYNKVYKYNNSNIYNNKVYKNSKAYKNNNVLLSPEVVSAEIIDGELVLTLDQPIQSGELHGFELAGPDGIFHNAEATSQGVRHFVRIDLTKCLTPCEVRYAWKDNPVEANVRSLTGLPMSSFELVINREQ